MSAQSRIAPAIDPPAGTALDHKPPIESISGSEKPAGRDPVTGRFARGWTGRPPGALNKRTVLRRALACDARHLLGESALSVLTDPVALRVALTRLLPPRTDSPVTLDLPALRTTANVTAASAKVIALVCSGELTPLEGTKVFALLEKHRRALRREERAQRARRQA
jgi:hypothetical protein